LGVALVTLAGTVVFLALAAIGWGGWAGLVAHPARAGAVAASVGFAVLAAFSGMSLSTGKREDPRAHWLFLPALVGSLVFAWLPPWTDRRELWAIDGDAVRWTGLVLFVVGCALRVWPMFVLGARFSAFVAIQEGHALVTDGLYGVIRHPSYLGGLLAFAGWALVFRSTAGLLLEVAALWLVVARIDAEEALLAGEFGAAWEAYRRRTWRLVPGVY
jgi:protein-S-isoprenylcysteine O-methyltransferase Ste14